MSRVPGLLLIFTAAVTLPAAEIVFSNLLQPGNQYGPDPVAFGHNIFLPDLQNTAAATRFTVADPVQLDSFEVPLAVMAGPQEINVHLMSELNGLPGEVLETIPVTRALPGTAPTPLTVIASVAQPTLLPGVPYWLAVSAGPATFANWALTTFQGVPLGSSDFATGAASAGLPLVWEIGTGGPNGREGAFQVRAAPIPEPAPAILTALGLFAIGLLVKRRLGRN